MTAGALSMTVLWMTLGQVPQAPSDVYFMNRRDLAVPVNVPPGARAEIRELRLFASRDQGASWQQVAVIGPDKNGFAFYAPTDGSYWLRVARVNLRNVQEPENLFQGPPDMKVVIDSLKPLIKLSPIQRNGAEAVVSWEMQEDHPDWSTFQLEYQPKDGASPFWTKIPANPGLSGTARFSATAPGPIAVRLQMRDMAGNAHAVFAETPGGAVPAGGVTTAQFTPGAPGPFPPPNVPSANVPAPPAGLQGPETSPSLQAPAAATPLSQGPPPTPLTGSGLPGNPGGFQPPVVEPKAFPVPGQPEVPSTPPTPPFPPPNPMSTQNPVPPPQNTTPPASPLSGPSGKPPVAPPSFVDPPAGGSPAPIDPPTGPSNAGTTPVEETKIIARTDGPVQTTSNAPQRAALPPLMYVNNPEVTLEYELAKVGPSGVASIELWRTQNDGKTWEMYAYEPSVDAKAGRHQSIVPLPGDGVYGFILIVKSKAGLGRRPPRAGDVPEIRVEVDTTAPIAQLAQPMVDPHRNNALLLRWAARDANLGPTPIMLEWAEKREGPWNVIAANLANTGRHSWQLPDRLPVAVYLRLRVKDLAGNESAAVTPEPQNVDLSEPEGRLLNVFVTPRR